MKERIVEALEALEASITRLEDESPEWAKNLSGKLDRILTVILETSKGLEEFRSHTLEAFNKLGEDVNKIDRAVTDHEVRISKVEFRTNGAAPNGK